ncbi:MAG: hypothetical protein AAEJ04_06400 [Planctomycetota bacterium]
MIRRSLPVVGLFDLAVITVTHGADPTEKTRVWSTRPGQMTVFLAEKGPGSVAFGLGTVAESFS